MRSYKSIVAETKNLLEIKGLIEVYEELAAGKMQKIRQFILSGREFFENMEKLSDEVGTDFESVISAEKKLVALFVSANTGLYGDIIDKTFKLFLEFISKNQAKVYIIGKLGEELMKSLSPKIAYQALAFPDDTIEQENIGRILQELYPYKKIMVFYGKFYNIAIQRPFMSKISGEMLPKSANLEELKSKRFRYLYEPSIHLVSEIFAGEILSSMLDQILRESQLAKQASRLMHLDEIIGNIGTNLTKLVVAKRNMRKKALNKKQNSMISGVMARGMG